MPIISKEHQIQEELSRIYESIILQQNRIKEELNNSRSYFDSICDKHIQEGFVLDMDVNHAKRSHQTKFVEYDIYCHIIEVINDYMDINGQFPEYKDMFFTLEDIMLQLAHEEKYELAGILKKWVDEIKNAILSNGAMEK